MMRAEERAEQRAMTVGWEMAVLGTALYDPQTMEVAEELLPSDFSGSHQVLWSEMLALYRRNALEERTLVEALRSAGQLDSIHAFDAETSGEDYINQLLTYRGQNIQEYVDRVTDTAMRRSLREVAGLIASEAEDMRVSALEATDNAERRLMSLRRNRLNDEATPLADITSVFIQRVEGFRNGTVQPAWVPYNPELRRVLRYLDEEDYMIIAGRPGMGKSSLMRSEFGQSALAGTPVLIFNLENSEIEYAKFMVSMITGINSELLKDPRGLTEEQMEQVRNVAQMLARYPLFVKTMGAPSALEIERISRQHISKKGIKLIGVDYVQLIRNGKEKKEADVSESSNILRAIPLRYHVPVIANAQMSRNVVHRGDDAEPELSDLRDSGALEQDATIVAFPWPMWSSPTDAQLRMFPENRDEHGRLLTEVNAIPIKIFIKKNRNGATGVTQPILWIKANNNFRALEMRTTNLNPSEEEA
jgi:replicative DNA helicase